MMQKINEVTILIPARLNSQRLPNKLLLEINGLPIIEHVRRRAELNEFGADVYVVSNDKKILKTISGYGGKTLQTHRKHLNGTSRCSEAAEQLKSKFYLILQGDEILALPRHINKLIIESINKPHSKVINLISKLEKESDLEDENIVKCLIGMNKQVIALFRKSPLTSNSKTQMQLIYKVLGMFLFESNILSQIAKQPIQPLEKTELIEQLRLQEIGTTINSLLVDISLESVNIATDLSKVKKKLKNDKEQKQILAKILNYEN
jgi:3-deoxy-manno-octulosonate cytidylyltransferase (CMP-KDO synthetase)